MSDAAGATALRTALAPAVTRRSLLVAAVVGTVLNAINQGDVVLAGEQPQWLNVALTYAVPFFVATYGAYCAARHAGAARLEGSVVP
jgi:hypothetical protein